MLSFFYGFANGTCFAAVLMVLFISYANYEPPEASPSINNVHLITDDGVIIKNK